MAHLRPFHVLPADLDSSVHVRDENPSLFISCCSLNDFFRRFSLLLGINELSSFLSGASIKCETFTV